MVKPKIAMWLFFLAGGLWMLAGIRDYFAPGFFSMSGRPVSGSSILVNFAVAIVFLVMGGAQAVSFRTHRNIKKS